MTVDVKIRGAITQSLDDGYESKGAMAQRHDNGRKNKGATAHTLVDLM